LGIYFIGIPSQTCSVNFHDDMADPFLQGNLGVNISLDRETRSLYTLLLAATDNANFPRTGFATVSPQSILKLISESSYQFQQGLRNSFVNVHHLCANAD